MTDIPESAMHPQSVQQLADLWAALAECITREKQSAARLLIEAIAAATREAGRLEFIAGFVSGAEVTCRTHGRAVPTYVQLAAQQLSSNPRAFTVASEEPARLVH